MGSSGALTAGTQGFLFCDLRGYSSFVDRWGDLAAADLLATYRTLVRAVVAEHDGAEIRTEGDSFYIVFPTASAAVDAGLGIVAAAAASSTAGRPIRVGVGVHAGETVASAEGPVGGAVNIAARVCAKAERGEVLVTDTVRSLTRTLLPYRFVGLGPQRLKGVGSVTLFRVEAVPASALAHLRRRLVARRRLVTGMALLVIGALVGGTAAWAATRPPDCLTLGRETKDVVARIDVGRGCVVQLVPVGRKPTLIVAAGDKLWVANADDGTVSALTATGKLIATIAAGRRIAALAANDADLWVLDSATGWFTRIALASATVEAGPYQAPGRGTLASDQQIAEAQARLSPGDFAAWYEWRSNDYRGAAVDKGTQWMSNKATGQIIPATLDGLGIPIPLDRAPDPLAAYLDPDGTTLPMTSLLAVVGSAVWAGHLDSPKLSVYSQVARTPCALTPPGASGGATGMLVMGDELWVTYAGGQVARVRSCEEGQAWPVSTSLSGVAGVVDAIWVASDVEHRVLRLDRQTIEVMARIDVGGAASGVAVGPDDSVWVTISG